MLNTSSYLQQSGFATAALNITQPNTQTHRDSSLYRPRSQPRLTSYPLLETVLEDRDAGLLLLGRAPTPAVGEVARLPGGHVDDALVAAARARVAARSREGEALAPAVRAGDRCVPVSRRAAAAATEQVPATSRPVGYLA